MASIFSINGYWKDDKESFSGHIVCESDDTPEGWDDEDIFFYGLSESEIKEAIELGEGTDEDYIIESYERLN